MSEAILETTAEEVDWANWSITVEYHLDAEMTPEQTDLATDLFVDDMSPEDAAARLKELPPSRPILCEAFRL